MNHALLRNLSIICLGIISQLTGLNAEPVKFFLPGHSYDSQIPTPEAYLGYELGEFHVRHDQVLGYLKLLAEKSNRVSFEVYGRTWEQKQQAILIISSEKNQQQLSQIKQQRQQPSKITTESPLVVWLGYSIHGNEASGTNASLAVAYHLAASQHHNVEQLLEKTVVLIDPSFNPDGYSRFSNWVNSNKALVNNGDPLNRELNEPWPGSRTNHYWFDLNRDWLLAVNPESQNRLRLFHQWHPHILTDHHEMGSDSSYFFQPGVRERQNPLTPTENFSLTSQLAKYHGKALDAQGQRYFTEEYFDDFYIGKGSTYPDINGSIGILFEQASVRGHTRKTINGVKTFRDAIKNHVTTSLSTLEGANALTQTVKEFQVNFFKKQKKSKKVFVISNQEYPFRAQKLVSLLQKHDIKVYRLAKSIRQAGKTIESGFVIPINQPHGKLIEGLFDIRTQFKDNTFYDVSAWALHYAYDIPLLKLNNLSTKYRGSLIETKLLKPLASLKKTPALAYVFEWKHQNSPIMLSQLLNAGLKMQVNSKPFSLNTNSKKEFFPGNIIVSINEKNPNSIKQKNLLMQLSQRYSIALSPFSTALTKNGIDLGSPNMKLIRKPSVALLTGDNINPYQAGEVRYLIEQNLTMPVSLITVSQINQKNLNNYSHLIMVNGSYQKINSFSNQEVGSKQQIITTWLKNGGTLIAFEAAAKWVSEIKNIEVKMEETIKDKEIIKRTNFSEKERIAAIDIIGGAIFNTDLDPSHPLGYGSDDRQLASFKTSRFIITHTKSPYDIVSRYTSNPLLSGYASNFNIEKIANTPMLVREKVGNGQVILFTDDPNFRGYWLATMRLFTNSLFFSHIH